MRVFRVRRGSARRPHPKRGASDWAGKSQRNYQRFRWSGAVWWAWLDLNQRPHPYQVSRAKRCADRRFPRSPLSVRGEGMRSYSPARTSPRTRCPWPRGKVCHQPVIGKVMGLPGGRGSPITPRDRGQAACPSRALWPARRVASTASPAMSAMRTAVFPGDPRTSRTKLSSVTALLPTAG